MTRKKSKTTPRDKGFDFGTIGIAMLVSSPEFMDALSRADIFGTAYGVTRSKLLPSLTLPTITLFGTNAVELERAFREFGRWSDETGDEAVELIFLFLNKGGYVLGISARTEFLKRRLGHHDNVHDPLFVTGAWLKYIPTRHTFLNDFRQEYGKRLIAPFIFNAASHPPVRNESEVQISRVRPIPGLKEILKFHVRFCNEDDVEPHSPEHLVLEGYRRMAKGEANDSVTHDGPPPPKPEESLRIRKRLLSTHFPVTLARCRIRDRYTAAYGRVRTRGIRCWQFEQAVCNLALSTEMCSGQPHYPTVRQGRLSTEIETTVKHRFEEADGTDALAHVTDEILLNQVRLDAIALLTHLGVSVRTNDFEALMDMLDRKGVLGEDPA